MMISICARVSIPRLLPIGEPSGITVARSDILQSFRQNRIGVDVGQHGETFLHEHFRRRQRFDRIGQQIARIGMNLELDPVRQSGGDGEPREAHRIGGVARAARVRQKQKTFRVDKIEDVRERIASTGKIGAAQRDRHQLRAARYQARRASARSTRICPCRRAAASVNSRSAIFSFEGLSDIAVNQ